MKENLKKGSISSLTPIISKISQKSLTSDKIEYYLSIDTCVRSIFEMYYSKSPQYKLSSMHFMNDISQARVI